MRWVKFLTVLALAVLVLSSGTSVVKADKPTTDYSDPVVVRTLVDQLGKAGDKVNDLWKGLTPEAKTAVLKYTRLERVEAKRMASDMESTSLLSTTCRAPTLAISGFNYLGVALWTYYQRIDHCFNGSVITWLARARWGTAHVWPWVFQGHIGDSTSGGVSQASYYAFTQGRFGNCPPWPGCVQYSTPWIWMRVYGDGRIPDGGIGY